jgi:hypothetical protein
MAQYSIMKAGMYSTNIGTLDTNISNPLLVLTVDSVSSIGPIAVNQGLGNSVRFYMPAIQNGNVQLIELWYTFGGSLPAAGAKITVDIVGY